MSEDLIIGKEETPEDSKVEEVDAAWEWTTREEYINCSYAALVSVDGWDPINKLDKARKTKIVGMCYAIIDKMVEEMYEEVFPPEDETEDE